jgi:hypothetical protein
LNVFRDLEFLNEFDATLSLLEISDAHPIPRFRLTVISER